MSEQETNKTPFNPREHLMTLKGQEYLEVKWRLVWLRSVHEDAQVHTEMMNLDQNHAVFRATIIIPGGGSATGHGSESRQDFMDFIEKAETKAIGRALAALGFGTQFTEDFDTPVTEDGRVRIVDAPVAPRQAITDYAAPPPHGRPQQRQPDRQIQITNPEGPASEKQVEFVKRMLKQKFPDGNKDIQWVDAIQWMNSTIGDAPVIDELTKQQASDLITALKNYTPAAKQDEPEGHQW